MADDPGDMDGFAEDPEVEQKVIMNANPNFLLATYSTVTTFLAAYGWFIVFAVIFLIILWSNIEKKVKKVVEKAKESTSEETSPEVLAQRAEAMELARQRMQEKASAVLRKEAERRKELEEKKRNEKLQDYDAMQSGKSSLSTQRKLQQNHSTPSTSDGPRQRPAARPLRDNDFNPLTGSSSSRYRPAPRQTGGG